MRRLAKIWFVTMVGFTLALSAQAETPASTTADKATVPIEAIVKIEPAADSSSIVLAFEQIGTRIVAVSAADKPRLTELKAGDRVMVAVDNPANPKSASSLDLKHAVLTYEKTALAIGISAAGIFVIVWMLMGGALPLRLIQGEDGRFSNSKAQMAFWAFAVISVYLGAVGLRIWFLGSDYIGGVEIPTNLLLLSGFSVFSFGAAKAITSGKIAAALDRNLSGDARAAAAVEVKPEGDMTNGDRAIAEFVPDLVRNDRREFDLGDTQMILITAIVIVIFIADSLAFLRNLGFQSQVSLPDVDTTLLSAFGLGQGAYLFKKAAGDPGSS